MAPSSAAARRAQRLQQIRRQDAAYATYQAAEYRHTKQRAERAAVDDAERRWDAERSQREARLAQQYEAAMAAVGQGHADAQSAEQRSVERASEQYWAFVRSQQSERQRDERALAAAMQERDARERPRAERVDRLRHVAEVEQRRAAVVVQAQERAAQPPAPAEPEAPQPCAVASTSTHLHAARPAAVVREEASTTAFDAARSEAAKAAAARQREIDAAEARDHAAAARGRSALLQVRTDKVRAPQLPCSSRRRLTACARARTHSCGSKRRTC